MKQLVRLTFILLSAAFILGCTSGGENPEQMIAAANALDQQFLSAYNSGDVDGVMATYWNSPELVSYPPGTMEARGWQAVKEDIAGFLASAPGLQLQLFDTNNKVIGDAVMGWGKWRITIPAGEKEPTVISGRYSDIKTKRNGKWVYILDHASVPLPPAPGAAEE